jgi:hypothetical protein
MLNFHSFLHYQSFFKRINPRLDSQLFFLGPVGLRISDQSVTSNENSTKTVLFLCGVTHPPINIATTHRVSQNSCDPRVMVHPVCRADDRGYVTPNGNINVSILFSFELLPPT